MEKNKDRFFNFDILKCTAISMVLFIHIVASELYNYGKISGNRWMMANIADSFSRMCVPIFVMVSGFFLLRKNVHKSILFLVILWCFSIIISLVCHFGFKDEYLGQNVEAFNPKLYEHVGWLNFLEEERNRLYILLITFAVSSFLTVFQMREYLNAPNMTNLIEVIAFYFIFYMVTAKSNFMKRMTAIKQLIKNK